MGKDAIMKILAVDYGASRTGLATCDASEFLTTAITPQITLKARPKVAARVCEIAAEIHAELIVVGLPLNMDGTRGGQAEKAQAFGKVLSDAGLDVRYQDERMTTVTAERVLISGSVRRENRKQYVDKLAAAVILEQWLASQSGAAERGMTYGE